jgi:hypothetical protein
MHENRQQDDDWQWDTNQPKQKSASETHDFLRNSCWTTNARRALEFPVTGFGLLVGSDAVGDAIA